MEQNGNDSAGAARNQNVVYVMPHDWAALSHFLAPLVDRIDPDLPAVQVLVATPDPDDAADAAAAVVRTAGRRRIGILAATSFSRGARLLALNRAQVVIGTPATLLDLVRASALKLDGLACIAIAWIDQILSTDQLPALEMLLADIPKEAIRTIVTAESTPGVEAVVERYARRARRVVSLPDSDRTPIATQYVTVSLPGRINALRRLLDDLNPDTAAVYVRSDENEQVVADLLRGLGYDGPGATVRVTRGDPGLAHLIVLFDLPASREELRETVGVEPRRVVALIQPRQLVSLRVLAGGGSVRPLTLPEAGERARDRDEATRRTLRDVLTRGQFGRELLTVEPLLEEYDGIEIAAAALQLLDRERSRSGGAAAHRGPQDGHGSTATTRLFLSIGARDGVRPADIVGAMTKVGEIAGSEIGRVDIHESHTIVEVDPSVADTIVKTLTGVELRGRRVIARLDQERSARLESGTAPRASKGARPGGRGPDRGDARAGRPPRDRGPRASPGGGRPR
ncbi:MAG TPA: DbpA RNA binding domain-containing protein [Gemmatimonadaceae bacterium]|nr:DbpA RNA binding domain-containing protein [Gemmatimonadaceae bacterium]